MLDLAIEDLHHWFQVYYLIAGHVEDSLETLTLEGGLHRAEIAAIRVEPLCPLWQLGLGLAPIE